MNFAPSGHSTCSGSGAISTLARQLSQPIPGREQRINTPHASSNPAQIFRQPVKHSAVIQQEGDLFLFQERQEISASKSTPENLSENKAQRRLEQILNHLAVKNPQPIRISDTDAERDLFIALGYYGNSQEALRLLRQRPHININAQPPHEQFSFLHYAAGLDDPRVLKALLAHPDIIVDNPHGLYPGDTPLAIAVRKRKMENIQLLMDAGANPHAAVHCKDFPVPTMTPLDWAEQQFPEALPLLSRKQSKNSPDSQAIANTPTEAQKWVQEFTSRTPSPKPDKRKTQPTRSPSAEVERNKFVVKSRL